MLVDERLDHRIQSTFHDLTQFVDGEIDTVIGDPPLRIIVGADTFGAIPRAD